MAGAWGSAASDSVMPFLRGMLTKGIQMPQHILEALAPDIQAVVLIRIRAAFLQLLKLVQIA